MARVTLAPHFLQHPRLERFDPGCTIGELLDDCQWDIRLDKYTVVKVGDDEIPRDYWDLVRLAEPDMVCIYLQPAGGSGGGSSGGKQIFAALALIAIAVAAPYIAAYVG